MESWVLDGDSYSFLRGAPRNINLQHLDGPNHVEIFDITSIPSHRSAISETTCLCDIFGDDCESPILSSSPASASFLKKDVEERTTVEDINDSSDSFHTANGSENLSDGSDTFEDSNDRKDLFLPETVESNTPARDLTFPNDKNEVTSAKGSPGYQQESHLSQDTSLVQVENSSDRQLVTSTSEFRDTNIRVTGSTQEIISPELLSGNKGIEAQSHATSSELMETGSTEEIISPDLRRIMKQRDASSSEQKENDLTQKIITPDSTTEDRHITEQKQTTTSEVREAVSTQENKRFKQREKTFSENPDSAESFNNLAAEASPNENNENNLGCSVEEEEKISLPVILHTGNILLHRENFPPLQKTASDPSVKDETQDLGEMKAPLEHEVVPNKSVYTGTFVCDDKAGLADLGVLNTVSPPTYIEDNREMHAASTPQHLTISSETTEPVILHESTTLSSFSDTAEGLSCVMSGLCSPCGTSEAVNSSEPSVIIHSPVGFTLCPSPESKNKIWSSGPEELSFTPESLESDYRFTPTDKGSVSSFDSKLSSTPEPRSLTSTPETRQNVCICELSPAAPSAELKPASCSPKIKIMTCSSPTRHIKSLQTEKKAPQNECSSQSDVLAQTHDLEGITHEKSFMSTSLPTKKDTDMVSSTQEDISCPSTTLPRDTVFLDLNGTRYIESPTSNILPTNEITNMASNISSTFLSTDNIQRCTESPDVNEIRSVESSVSTITTENETTNTAISPDSHISTEGGMSTPPSTLCIPGDTASLDVVGTRDTESSMSTTIPTMDIEYVSGSHIFQPLSAEGDISRPQSNLSAQRDTTSPDVDGNRCVESPVSASFLINETTIMDISIESNYSPTVSNESLSKDTMSPDVEGCTQRYTQSSVSDMVPLKDVKNMIITPITYLSSTDGGVSRTPSTSSIPRDTMSPYVVGTRCVESSLSTSPTNETTNIAISPISNLSLPEGSISRPSSTLSIPRNTPSPDTGGRKSEENPASTTVVINEMTYMANSPINLSLTGSTSRPPSNLSIQTDAVCLDVKESNYTKLSNEIPTNETTNVDISPISNISSAEGSISRLPSTSNISKNIMSADLDGLICVESFISTTLPKYEPPNKSISPVLNILSKDGGIVIPSSTLHIPRDTVFSDGEGIRYVNDSMSTILPTNIAISPVYSLSSTDGCISRQQLDLSTPRDTTSPDEERRYTERFNEISTNENKGMASPISNLTTPSNILTDFLTSESPPKVRYLRSPERFNDHTPEPEMCIPKAYIDNHLSTTVSEKVDLPLKVQVDVGQIDTGTGYKTSLKSCGLNQDDCTDIAPVPFPQIDKISDPLPEPPTPRLSVKQIKENWERMNETILNSLNPWQTSKKILTVSSAKEAKEGHSAREMLESESAGSEKTFGQMAMRPGESPSVLHSDNARVIEGQSCRNKGWSGERGIQEEHTFGKGVGNIAEGSYRGEQVELSFSTRNRKGPANRSPAPSSRDPKSGIPPRYFESPQATRRQQSLLRAQNLQTENKTGARRVRLTSKSNYSGAGRLSSECTSETSSMGSEFDDADSEVKWFTDQAFRSLSSPQVDYLDVYNSSRGSSTNVSQPSTVDSFTTWNSYADLHKSSHENDDFSCHTSFLPHSTLDPAKRFEMGSFECVDVAVENKEETKKGKRTVPKRQIQFKRRNFDELKSTENEDKAMESLSTQVNSRDIFFRQHSTPASMQDDLVQDEQETQTGKKMLQKSASLDDSSPKSKMASSVIKSVLSKKMDTSTKESLRSEPCENKKKHIENLFAGESNMADRQSSSLHSECSLSSDDFAGKEQRSPNTQKRGCRPKVPPKPAFKANFLPPNSNSAGMAFQGKPLVKDQIKPIRIDASESKISKKLITENSDMEVSKQREKSSSDSGRSINQTTHCTAICVASTQRRMTNSDSQQPMIPETHKQQDGSSSMFLSKTPEITLKPCTIKDKNISSLKASLCSELEISKDVIREPMLKLEETPEEQTRCKTGVGADTKEDNAKNNTKSVIHKVKDVRKLVKNTYNLSFKASNSPSTHHLEDVIPVKQKEMQPENPHPLQIECKAISWKEKQSSCNKSTNQQDVTQTADNLDIPQMDTLMNRDVGNTKVPAKTSVSNVQHSDVDLFVGKSISKSGNCEQSTRIEIPSRPPSKEISTLVFMQDGTTKSIQKPTSPTSPSVQTANSSHSVSMLRKEKGMQADIGVCDVLSEGPGAKPKHINRLDIPLLTYASEETSSEIQKVKKEDAELPPEQKTSINSDEDTLQVRSSPKPKEVKVYPNEKSGDKQSQGDSLQPPKEQEITVRAFSSNTKIHAMPVTTSKEIELPIQVRSISGERPKPSVLPKPSYKQPFAEIRSTSNDFPKTDITPTTSILKEQTHLKSEVKIIEASASVINNEQSTNVASCNTKKLAVSGVSSHKPQTIPVTTMSSSAQKSTAITGRQEVSITSLQNSSNRQQHNVQEQVIPSTPYASNYQTLPVVKQADTYMQPTMRTNNHLHKDDFHFATSDDPPSYDERESFSPLPLSDLPPRRQNRYHPTTKHSLCSCTSCTHPQFGQPYHGSQNQTPPAPRSPGQVISYPGAPPQAQVRPHQCRPDGQPSNYPPVSPKTTVQQSPAMIQPMHHSHTCPAPAIQPFGNEQQQLSTQHRRSGNQRSPQAPSGTTYREHSRSPNIAALDPRSQFFNPQELPPPFGHEYGSDGPGGGGVLYPENASGLGYGQGPRRVLLDPESGKYFYIEVPMQPLRKMLFDPEIGQYVEVLIPQQAMSNSNMYPPTSAQYQGPYHGQGLYASQYLPYAMPPHPQSAQQPRHPEPSVPTSLHQNTMGYGNSASQVPKSDVKGHPSLDQSYLESMYYIPTGMNASPNSTPSDCYHKPATNMPAAGGRRA